jgi:hypothetical protein
MDVGLPFFIFAGITSGIGKAKWQSEGSAYGQPAKVTLISPSR